MIHLFRIPRRPAFGQAGSILWILMALCWLSGWTVLDVAAQPLSGELRGSSLLQFQVGRDPRSPLEEERRTRLFNQVILDYNQGSLGLGLRVERFQDSADPLNPEADNEYSLLTQRYVEWSSWRGRLRVGNAYAIFGRGLLLRAFELPGVIRQTLFPTTSYTATRDIDGALLEWTQGPVGLVAVTGVPVVRPDRSPGDRIPRREGSISGAQVTVDLPRGARLGGAYVRSQNVADDDFASRRGQDHEDQGSVSLSVDLTRAIRPQSTLPVQLLFYGEYAGRAWRPLRDGLDTATGSPHALYTAVEVLYPSGGLSWETKDYHQFQLGANDLPTLVPEFGGKLLNRGTHVLAPVDERGHQLAWSQALPPALAGGTAEIIYARSVGRRVTLGLDLQQEFFERSDYELGYARIGTDPGRHWNGGIYAAAGKDEYESISKRHTIGAVVHGALTPEYGMEAEVSYQTSYRDTFDGGEERFNDFAASLAFSIAGRAQVGLDFERSNDPSIEDDVFTPDVETDTRTWLALVGSVQIRGRHEATLFVGSRRGGTACVSGTCYFVPDFEGAELRLSSRF